MRLLCLSALSIILASCAANHSTTFERSDKLDAAKNIVDSVNAKDSASYIKDLAEDVVVTMYDGEVRLRGRDQVEKNRQGHFLAHPNARNVLIHLVEIDNQVIMHDRVWLTAEQIEPADIVEVFTFENDKIIRIDVIQPKNLFNR